MFNEQKYNNNYKKENYEQISIRYKPEKDYKNRLKLLSIGTNKTIVQLICEAIDDLLNKYNA